MAVMQVSLFAKTNAVLGESPLWDDSAGRLFWVDIRRSLLEWLESDNEGVQQRRFDVRLSALGLRSSGGLIAAGDHAVGVVDWSSGRFEERITFEPDRPRNRTNDGGVGADGRFWFGTMDDQGEPGCGGIYSVAPDWTLKRAVDALTIPNGLVTNLNGTVLFAADSGRQIIEARVLDPATGALSEARPFAAFIGQEYTPDGAALDEEGCMWSALWDGGAIVRLTPDGRRERTVSLPVSRPTSCTFGGSDLRTLYVTSARDGLAEAALCYQPLAGSVFAIATGIKGLPAPVFDG